MKMAVSTSGHTHVLHTGIEMNKRRGLEAYLSCYCRNLAFDRSLEMEDSTSPSSEGNELRVLFSLFHQPRSSNSLYWFLYFSAVNSVVNISSTLQTLTPLPHGCSPLFLSLSFLGCVSFQPSKASRMLSTSVYYSIFQIKSL